MSTGREHGKIILAALIGPAAFAVICGFIGESGIHCAGKIERCAPVTLHIDIEVDGALGDFSSCRSEKEPQRINILAEGAIVLNENIQFPAESQFIFRKGQDQGCRLAPKQGRS